MVGFQPRRVEKPCSRGVLHFGSEDSMRLAVEEGAFTTRLRVFLKFVGVWRMKRDVEANCFIPNTSGMDSGVNGGESPPVPQPCPPAQPGGLCLGRGQPGVVVGG